jgi:hypothetical protein
LPQQALRSVKDAAKFGSYEGFQLEFRGNFSTFADSFADLSVQPDFVMICYDLL